MQGSVFLRRICVMVFMLLVVVIPSVSAMEITSHDRIISFGIKPFEGDTEAKVRDEDGTKLQFSFYEVNPLYKSYIKFMSRDKKSDYFSFPVAQYTAVTEIKTSDPNKVFWLITDTIGVSSQSYSGFWLIGKYKGKYVDFVNLDLLIQSGFTPQNVQISYESDGSIVLRQYKRNWGDEMRTNGMFSYVNSVTLFWDDTAQWFGIRH